MSEIDLYEAPIANEIVRVIDTALATELGLKKCEAGDLDSFPAADELADALNAIFVGYKEWNLEDVRPGSPQASQPVPPGVEVEYLFEVVFIRLQGKDEDPHAKMSEGLRKIAKIFLNGHRKLPGLQQPGCRVKAVVPVRGSADNPYNDMYDVPELGANAGVLWLHVYTRSV